MADFFKAENTLNNEDDSLPYGYYNPDVPESDGQLTWMCGKDAAGKITSVYTYDNGNYKDKRPSYLKDEEEARMTRDTLVENGWMQIALPKITFTQKGDPKGVPKELTRKDRRGLTKKLKKDNKKNPFV